MLEQLGIQLDHQLNYSSYISNICKSAANQLNALIRLQKFLRFEGKKILINSYSMGNFNYCPLVRMFSNAVFPKKLGNLQKQALRILCKINSILYEDLLLKSGFSSITVKRLRRLCVKIFKTLNNRNPNFMKEIFSLR